MTMRVRLVGRVVALVAVASFVATACGSSNDSSSGGSSAAGLDTVEPTFASFDPFAGAEQRVMVGLIAGDGRVVAGGSMQFAFSFQGTREQPQTTSEPGPTATAEFLPIPNTKDADVPKQPELVRPSRVTGVYGANVTLPRAGIWGVRITGDVSGERLDLKKAFEVSASPQVVAVGQAAPRTNNPIAGDPNVPAVAIDSRAQDGQPIPDPELHTISVADALANGKPTMVVVATPVYCVSQFCGPITDEVARLQRQYGAQMNFVHLEVWKDFENQQVNDTALEWIGRKDGGDANEPWVFVIDRNGTVIARFDNVATRAELQRAVQQALQP